MKKLMNHAVAIVTAALLAAPALTLVAQIPLPPQTDPGTNEWGTNGFGTNEWHGRHHGHMRAEHQQMKALIKQQDAELQQLLTQMTNAPAGLKQDAIAALVGKLVEDRLALHAQIEAMHQPMGDTNNPSTNAVPTL
jgi:Spy/CpxP family protein refolding chaperone